MHKMHNFTTRIKKIEDLAREQEDLRFLRTLRAMSDGELLAIIREDVARLRDAGLLFPEFTHTKEVEGI